MCNIHKKMLMLPGTLAAVLLTPLQIGAQADSSAFALAQKQISAYLTQLADVHCTEKVTQERLAADGHVEATEREQYDYLIMIGGNEDDFQLSESRIESPGWRHKQLTMPMMVTNGMATILLVFHPYYRESFDFETQPEEMVDGRPAVPIRFTQIRGRRSPAALALRGREYPLELQGTAWLDKSSGGVLKADASLLHEMDDVRLRSLDIHVEYKPIQLRSEAPPIMMPALVVVNVTTPRQHWRNTHFFGNYRSFSADAEQDPKVKIHADNEKPDDSPATASPIATTKEKP